MPGEPEHETIRETERWSAAPAEAWRIRGGMIHPAWRTVHKGMVMHLYCNCVQHKAA